MTTRPIPAAPYPTSRSTRTTHSATICTTVDPGGRPALARSSDSIRPHRGGHGRCAVRAHSCADCLCDMSSSLQFRRSAHLTTESSYPLNSSSSPHPDTAPSAPCARKRAPDHRAQAPDSLHRHVVEEEEGGNPGGVVLTVQLAPGDDLGGALAPLGVVGGQEHQPDHRSKEHTSELQSRGHLVCR